jgi:poly(beta-D-mannuronate) lyase
MAGGRMFCRAHSPFVSVLLATLLAALPLGANSDHSPLRSPWDLHPVTLTENPYSCPAASDSLQLPHDFNTFSYYTDKHASVIDPVLKKKYEDSVAPVEDFSRKMVKAADAYQTSGSRAAALCVLSMLELGADQKVLAGRMEAYQSTYVQGWNWGSWAVAWLKIRGSALASEEQSRRILHWLRQIAQDNQHHYDEKRQHDSGGPSDARNNHLYWAGFAIAAAGIASNDRALFDWGMDAYRTGVRDIPSDDTLPMEMARGQMALHYHLYALAPLVMLAEFGEANGIDLYAEQDRAILRLVKRCILGRDDPSFFQQQTGVAQAPWLNYTSWGGLPPP